MICTARLLLRRWRDDDLAPFAAMNADPEVRAYFHSTLDRAASDASAERIRRHIDAHGFGFWAVEIPGVTPFIGFVGLKHVPDELPFAPGVEIGWRLGRRHWGQGFATEAAIAARDDGFGRLRLPELVAYAVATNAPSRAVMARIGMREVGGFDDPELPADHALRRCVLYRLAAPR